MLGTRKSLKSDLSVPHDLEHHDVADLTCKGTEMADKADNTADEEGNTADKADNMADKADNLADKADKTADKADSNTAVAERREGMVSTRESLKSDSSVQHNWKHHDLSDLTCKGTKMADEADDLDTAVMKK